MRQDPRLLRGALGVRAANLRARARRERQRARSLHSRLLPPRAGALRRDHGDEAVPGHAQEPQAAQAARPPSRTSHQALLQARHRAAGAAIPPRARQLASDPRVGDLYLSQEEVLGRVGELGAEIARDYGESAPLLIAPLKSSFVFLADLSRRLPIAHELEFVELAG